MLRLQDSFSITTYLEQKVQSVEPLLKQLLAEGKPGYIIEELCLNEMTKDLRPSKYNYIKELLEAEFEADYNRFREMGMLTYEIVNLIEACNPVFEQLGFSEDRAEASTLKHAIIGAIGEYLEGD